MGKVDKFVHSLDPPPPPQPPNSTTEVVSTIPLESKKSIEQTIIHKTMTCKTTYLFISCLELRCYCMID